MKHIVSIAIDGRIDIEVDASDFETAKKLAINKFHTTDIDLNQIDIIGSSAVNVTRADGEFYDY